MQDNQFRYLGASVLVVGDPHYDDTSRDPWDMTDENHPVGTTVQRNLIRFGHLGEAVCGFFLPRAGHPIFS